MIKDELSQAVTIANTVNNEGTRVEMKVDAAIKALMVLLDFAENPQLERPPGGPSPVWICEQHPELEWPHDDCAGPGMLSADRRIELLEADVRELRGFLNLRPGDFALEPVFLGPGANDVFEQLQPGDPLYQSVPQVLEDAKTVEETLTAEDPAPAVAETPGYADHASQAPSTALYDVMPERKKLERMTVEDLKALAGHHGITLADGTKATIIDSMIGPEASGP